MSIRIPCRSCNSTFQDSISEEVHYQYSPSCSNRAEAVAAIEREKTDAVKIEADDRYSLDDNPNSTGTLSNMTAISPGIVPTGTDDGNYPNSPHSMAATLLPNGRDSNYEMNQHAQGSYATPEYILGADYGMRPVPHSGGPNSVTTPSPNLAYGYNPQQDSRYHPYYKQGFRDPLGRNHGPIVPQPNYIPQPHIIPSPFRCDKCDFSSVSQEMMMHHMSMVHPVTAPPQLRMHGGAFNPPRYGLSQGNAIEPQAEILDLDSQKVHVYQPPNGQPPNNHAMDNRAMIDNWMRHEEEKKYYQHQQLQLSQHSSSSEGRGSTPLPSPDFGSVSTTTENIKTLQNSYQPSSQYEQNGSSGSQISSSDSLPTPRASKKKDAKNADWKSNEARRPKTYNCTACNKWFTSSGHLKRHYNTTLHKNAVKQSGMTDPATVPISVHHHPQKDPSYVPSNRHHKNSSAALNKVKEEDPPDAAQQQTHPFKVENNIFAKADNAMFGPVSNHQQQLQTARSPFLTASPNAMAGPSEGLGGLPHHSHFTPLHTGDQIKSPSPITTVHPLSYHHFQQPTANLPFFQQHTPTSIYPNFQSPHVFTQIVTKNSPTGNSDMLGQQNSQDEIFNDFETFETLGTGPLPSFFTVQRKVGMDTQFSGLEQVLGSFEPGNVGGQNFFSNYQDGFFFDSNFRDEGDLVQYSGSFTIKQEGSEHTPESDEGMSLDLAFSDADNAIEKCQLPPLAEPTTDDSFAVTSSTAAVLTKKRSKKTTTAQVEPKSLECDICCKVFNRACYLTQHNKSFHSGFKPFKCHRCGKRFTESQQFEHHKEKHAGDKPYKCDLCPKQFNYKTDLRRHVCLHTDVRPFSCDLCNKGFIRKDHMLKHRDTHANKSAASKRQAVVNAAKMLLKVKSEIAVC